DMYLFPEAAARAAPRDGALPTPDNGPLRQSLLDIGAAVAKLARESKEEISFRATVFTRMADKNQISGNDFSLTWRERQNSETLAA
ncbi:MAG: hypothetical protein J0J15_22860, partial [Mesorhizobium sp.]|nr:hypothetical protein [Mesorhizobium sp.]